MERKALKNNELQNLMVEVAEAERAGVFNRTAVDSAALLDHRNNQTNPTRPARFRGWGFAARILTPIAACVGLWIGVNETGFWTPDGAAPLADSIAHNTNAALVGADENCYDIVVFDSCRTGPAGLVSGDCACVDFDRDGDVDFADFGQFQRLATSRRG